MQGRKRILEVAKQIAELEKQCGIDSVIDDENKLKFGLVEVVYEWANGKVRTLKC